MPTVLIQPISVTAKGLDNIGAAIHVLAGTAGPAKFRGFRLPANVAAVTTLDCLFMVPSPLPAGTPKLRLIGVANATTGRVSVNPKWVAFALPADPSGQTVVAEGVSDITWTTGDANKLRVHDFTLDATTAPAADQMLAVQIVFEVPASTKLAVPFTFIPFLIYAS